MELLAYFRVLRRRWLVILALTLVGAGIGAGTAVLEKGSTKSRTYYKATNTLALDTSQDGSAYQSAFRNLDQIAILTTTGDVPNRVAKTLGTTEIGRQLAEHVITTTNGTTITLDITAADPDPKQAVALADTFADQLVASLDEKDQARFAKSRDDTLSRLNKLKDEKASLDAEIAAKPLGADLLTAQRDSVVNQYRLTYENFQQLAAANTATSRLSTLETAESIPISSGEYSARLTQGQLGVNNIQAGGSSQAATSIAAQTDSSFKGPVSRGVLGGLLGLIAGIGLALVADRLDRRIRTREDAETAFGLPVLADVPLLTRAEQREDEVVAHTAPLSRIAEAYRAVRSSLLFQHASTVGAGGLSWRPDSDNGTRGAAAALFEPPPQGTLVVMVASAVPKEGKTTTSASLAAVFAEAGSTVLVVNCDFRRPAIHRFFGVEDEARRVYATPIPGVSLVANVLGDPGSNPAQVVAAQRQVIAKARGRFDVIILDTAPLLTANDAVELVSSADIVLLVARAGMSTTDGARRAMELLGRLDAPLSGVVLVAVGSAPNNYYYYYQRSTAQQLARKGTGKAQAGAARANGDTGNGAPARDDLFRTAGVTGADEPEPSS